MVEDPSGAAIIAAERPGCIAYEFDFEPRYCSVILSQFESYAGQEAGKCDG